MHTYLIYSDSLKFKLRERYPPFLYTCAFRCNVKLRGISWYCRLCYPWNLNRLHSKYHGYFKLRIKTGQTFTHTAFRKIQQSLFKFRNCEGSYNFNFFKLLFFWNRIYNQTFFIVFEEKNLFNRVWRINNFLFYLHNKNLAWF